VKIQSVSCIRDLTLYPTTTRARHRTILHPRAHSHHDDHYHHPVSPSEHPSASSIDQPPGRGDVRGFITLFNIRVNVRPEYMIMAQGYTCCTRPRPSPHCSEFAHKISKILTDNGQRDKYVKYESAHINYYRYVGIFVRWVL